MEQISSTRTQSGLTATSEHGFNRRNFLKAAALLSVGALAPGCRTSAGLSGKPYIIDIHQHAAYSGRPDDNLLDHQQAMGVSLTILLPAGHPVNSATTHQGVGNGLQAQCFPNEACYRLAKDNPGKFLFAANEVPDVPGAVAEIERYLKLGAVAIAEQKFGIECDAAPMQRLYALAADYDVPILMHWQHKMYSYGFDRFYRMLEKFPRTRFIGHAQTWWGNVDQGLRDPSVLYPKGKITPGGLTDRYLADYPNMFGDLSAGSGLNALSRDPEFTVEFLKRHQDKLLFGSDCNDRQGTGSACIGSQTIATVRRQAASEVQEKIFWRNAKRVFKI